jgi:pimeloyl-ACP methyl ester carboxylesterase
MNNFWMIITSLGFLFLVFNAWGLYLRDKGQAPLDEEALRASGSKFVRNKDNRVIEYRCYGSSDPHAPVVINIHGSGLEAGYEEDLYKESCLMLGVRGIAISLPGCGYSDVDIGRRVVDWPNHDLLPVLDKENVEDFFITGHSQGCAHAMAAAFVFSRRCVGLGLNAPLLSTYISKKYGIPEALGSGGLLKTDQLHDTWMGWYFATMKISIEYLSPVLPIFWLVRTSPKLKGEGNQLARLQSSLRRAVVRNSVGGTWESTQDVCYEWGFNPLGIETNNVSIWHAGDDKYCPPEIGEWFAQQLLEKESRHVDFKSDEIGLGHFTFCGGIYKEPERSLVKSLLDHSSGVEMRKSA